MSTEPKYRVEWAVGHSQGIHPGPFSEQAAREWIANDIANDCRRQLRARGRQRLLRRLVTEWEEIPIEPTHPERPTEAAAGEGAGGE